MITYHSAQRSTLHSTKNTKSAHTQLQNTKLSVTFRINWRGSAEATIALPLPPIPLYLLLFGFSRSFFDNHFHFFRQIRALCSRSVRWERLAATRHASSSSNDRCDHLSEGRYVWNTKRLCNSGESTASPSSLTIACALPISPAGISNS